MISLEVSKHFDNIVGRSLSKHKQGLAIVVPYILEEEFPELSILHLDKGLLVLQDKEDIRYKVFCSRSNSFNLAPSYTKGYGRDVEDVCVKYELENICDKVILVNFSNINTWTINILQVKDFTIDWDGVFKCE
jgi:hypothetical protein